MGWEKYSQFLCISEVLIAIFTGPILDMQPLYHEYTNVIVFLQASFLYVSWELHWTKVPASCLWPKQTVKSSLNITFITCVFLRLPICFPFITFTFCLYFQEILHTADLEQENIFCPLHAEFPSWRGFIILSIVSLDRSLHDGQNAGKNMKKMNLVLVDTKMLLWL